MHDTLPIIILVLIIEVLYDNSFDFQTKPGQWEFNQSKWRTMVLKGPDWQTDSMCALQQSSEQNIVSMC